MHRPRLFAAGLILSIAVPLGAQNAGSIEIGGFGQFTRLDEAWHLSSGPRGAGARFGVFLHPRVELEGDASFASFSNQTPRPGGSTTGQTFAARLNFNIPVGMHQLLIGTGAGGQRFDNVSDFSVSPGVGVRFMLGPVVALRFDALVEWVENRTAPTFQFPSTPGANVEAARSTNLEIRAGLSFLTGMKRVPPAPPPTVVTQVQPEPRPTVEPQPERRETPPPVRENRDSLAAVNRARETLTARVLFEFDRSELRADQAAILDAKIPVMRANPPVRIRIVGNADERGSDEYNMALGMRRAEAAKKYLVDHGIEASRIDIASVGEERPLCSEQNESCWAQNRRDEFVIVAGGDSLVAPR